MKDLFAAINERSSIRGYADEPLSAEQNTALVEFGLKAPTARNEQELHFTIIDGKGALAEEIGKELNPANPLGYLYGAPTFILISGKDDFSWTSVDAGIAVENIHLGAIGLGLGSVIIGCIEHIVNGARKEYYREALGIPEGYSFRIAIAVGRPVASKAQHTYSYDSQVTDLM